MCSWVCGCVHVGVGVGVWVCTCGCGCGCGCESVHMCSWVCGCVHVGVGVGVGVCMCPHTATRLQLTVMYVCLLYCLRQEGNAIMCMHFLPILIITNSMHHDQ